VIRQPIAHARVIEAPRRPGSAAARSTGSPRRERPRRPCSRAGRSHPAPTT